MRKSFAFNRIISFLLVMVMVIIMVPTHFFPKAAEKNDTETKNSSSMFIRNGDVSVEGNLQRGTTLKASKLDNPFDADNAKLNLLNSVKGASFVNGISPVPAIEGPAETEDSSYSRLNYLGFYDISLRKGGADVQPDGTVKVTINNLNLTDVSTVKVIHILDTEEAVINAIKTGKANWVRDIKFVNAFLEESIVSQKVIKEDNVVIVEELDAEIINEHSISFSTTSFSIYAIVDIGNDEHTPRVIYKFEDREGNPHQFLNSANQRVDQQVIKTGDSLQSVGIPAIDSSTETLVGWYIYDKDTNEYTGTSISFGTSISVNVSSTDQATITSNSVSIPSSIDTSEQAFVIYVRPYYGPVRYINLYNDPEGTVLYSRLQIPVGASYDIGNESAIPPDAIRREDEEHPGQFIIEPVSLAFTGWSTDKFLEWNNGDNEPNDPRTPIINTIITVSDEDLYFYPIFKKAHWVSFTTAPTGSGATFIPPVYIQNGQSAASARPTVSPVWEGHSFVGWFIGPDSDYLSMDERATGQFNFNSVISDDIMLYAHWNAGYANYTIVYWQQLVSDNKNANDASKHYEYSGQTNNSGRVNTTVSPTTVATIPVGFKVNTVKSDTNVQITPDGKAVLNVYLDRNLITMNFIGYYSTTTFTGLYGQTLAQNGYSWPGNYGWEYRVGSSQTYSMSYLGEFVLPANRIPGANVTVLTVTFSIRSASNTIYYYLQNEDGSWPVTPSGRGITAATSIQLPEKYAGFTVDAYEYNNQGRGGNYSSGSWQAAAAGQTVNVKDNMAIRYRRLQYNVKFLDSRNGTPLADVPMASLMYGLPFSNVKPNRDNDPDTSAPTIAPPSSQFEWTGKWYSDQACTTEFDWSLNMPSHDVAVYVDWSEIWYWVKVDPNGGELTATEATYFWETLGDKIEEYHDVTRIYVEDDSVSDSEAWYYHYDEFNTSDPDGDQPYSVFIVDGVEQTRRAAFYTKDASLSTDGKKYRQEVGSYSLVGWYEVDLNTGKEIRPYNFAAGISGNTYIRAIWRQVGEYKLIYSNQAVDQHGNPLNYEDDDLLGRTGRVEAIGTMPIDGNSYADQSHTAVEKNLNESNTPQEYSFIGWYYDKAINIAGDQITVKSEYANHDKEIFLYPVFSPIKHLPVEATQVRYHDNYSSGDGSYITELPIKVNENIDIRGTESYFTRTGYRFIGWSKNEGATTPWIRFSYEDGEFYLGEDIVISIAADNNDAERDEEQNIITYKNDLWAVWEKKVYTVTVEKIVSSGDYEIEGDQNVPFVFVPDFEYITADNQSNFSLTGEDTQVSYVDEETGDTINLTYENTVVFEGIPYDTTFSIAEALNESNYFALDSVVMTLVKDVDGNDDGTETSIENGEEITVNGDIKLTFTNKRKTVDLDIAKVVISSVSADSTATYTFTINYMNGETEVSTPVSVTNGVASPSKVTVPMGVQVTVKETPVVGMETSAELTKGAADQMLDNSDENGVVNGTDVSFTALEDSTVTYTNTRPNVKVTVKKVTEDNGTYSFPLTLTETNGDENVHNDKSVSITQAAEYTIPAGTTFTLEENMTDVQKSLYLETPEFTITSEEGTITKSGNVYTALKDGEITITNNRKPVVVTIVKTVDSNLKSDYKEYSFDYYVDGATEKTGDVKVAIPLPESGTTNTASATTVIEVPYGKTVKIVETTADPYITVESNIDGKAGDATLTSNALINPAYTATFTNTRPNYTVTVSKVTDDIGTINDSFKMVLTKLAETVIGDTTIEDSVILGTGAKNATFTLPAGMTFKFAEELTDAQKALYNYAEGQPLYEVGGGVSKEGNNYTITDNGTIKVTNYRNPIKVKITKTVISPVKADFATYKFKYFIGNSTEGLNAPDAVVTWPTDGSNTASVTVEFMVPYGSTVRVEEQDIDTNAITVESSFGTKTGNVTIELGQLTALENVVEYTNTRNMVDVKVKKVVENFNGTAVFPFSASWTIGTQTDEPVAVTNDANKLANNAEWSFKVPYGANVKVKETGSANVKINDVDYAISTAFTTVNDAGTSSDEGRTGVTAALTDKANAKVITFTNTRKTVNATITKTLDNKGVSDDWSTANFNFNYSITDNGVTTEYNASNSEAGRPGLSVAAGATGTITGIPFGATITVTEDQSMSLTKGGHMVSKLFTVSGDNGKTKVAATTAPSFNIVNTRKIVDVTIVKKVLSDDAADIKDYTFNVTTAVANNYAGTDVTKSGTQTVTVGSGKTGSVTFPIPAGTDVTIVETGVSAEKFETFVAIDDNAALKQLDASLTDVIAAHTVTYTNRKILTVTVNKIVVSGLAADFTSYPFAISYYDIDGKLTTNVVVPGSNGQNRSVSVSATGVAGETPITFPVPYGTTNLSVAEVLGDAAGSFTTALDITGAAGSAGDNNQSATVATVNVDTTITFTNTRKMQTITVEKAVDSLLADDLKAYTFTYGYKYYAVSGEQTVANATIDVTVSSAANPATATFEIPYDAHAFEISEPDNSGTTTVLTTVTGTGSLANGTASDANRKYAVTANITADGKVSFTNKRVVYVTVRKILDSLDSGNDFTFEYSYTYKGTEVKQQITIEDVPVDSTGKAYAPVIEIPYGVEVTVTETTTEGYSTYVLVPYGSASQNTAVSGSATITSGTEAKPEEFVFTNHRVVPLKVTKVVDSEEPSDKVTRDYDFTVTYNYTGATGNVTTEFTITVDEMLFGDNTIYVPFGATNIVITETPVDGYDTVAVSKTAGVTGTNTGSEYVKNVFTITGALEKAATVEYTNIRMVEVTVIKELDSEETDAMTKTFYFNYTYTGSKHNTNSAQEFTITMPNALTGSTVIRVPYGVKLTVNELINQTDYDTYYGFNGAATGTAGTTAKFANAIVDNNSSVKFSNKRMVNVKFIKNVDDPALSTENNKYTFKYTYTYNNTANTPDPVVITVDTTSARGETEYFRIPYNAANFVVTETIDLRVFDVDADSTGTAGTLNGAAYTLSQNVTAVNTDIHFYNQRMVEVEVVKKVESSEQADKNANYSVTYGYTRTATGSIASAVNITGQTGTIKDATDGKLTVRMPYGSMFTVTETGDLSKFQVLYSTTDNTALTEGKEVTLANVTAAKTVTVTFTNRKLYTVTVRKHVDNTVNGVPVTDRLDSAAFDFTYIVGGTVGYNTASDGSTFSLTNYVAGATPVAEKVITLPYGASFVLEEIDTANFSGTGYKMSDLFTVKYADAQGNLGDDGFSIGRVIADTVANVYNTRNTREITVKKTLDSQVAADFHAYTFNWAVANWTSGAVTLTPVTQKVPVSTKLTVPVGLQVTVTEDNTKPSASAFVGMDTTVRVGNGEAAEGYTGTVPAGLENVTVYFVNTRVTADLTITKTIDGDISKHVPALEGRTFMFRITANENGYTYDHIVMIKGAGSVTISQLQTGYNYTVTEITGWSYEFDASGAYYAPVSAQTNITNGTKADTVTFLFVENGEAVFSNAANDTNWLRGEAYADNRFDPNQK